MQCFRLIYKFWGIFKLYLILVNSKLIWIYVIFRLMIQHCVLFKIYEFVIFIFYEIIRTYRMSIGNPRIKKCNCLEFWYNLFSTVQLFEKPIRYLIKQLKILKCMLFTPKLTRKENGKLNSVMGLWFVKRNLWITFLLK